MNDLVGEKALKIGSELENAASTLKLLADYVTYIYQNSERFGAVPFNHCRFNTGTKREMQWMLSPGMSAETTGQTADLEQAGVLQETFLLGNMQGLFEPVISGNPNISCIYTTSASGVNTAYDDKSLLKLSDDISSDVVDLRTEASAWYFEAARDLELKVTDTYQDSFGRGLCITFSAPYFGENGQFVGVIGMDFLIRDLSENILNTAVSENGYSVLVNVRNTENPHMIAAPEMDMTNQNDMELFLGNSWKTVLDHIDREESGVEQSLLVNRDQTGVYIIWAPIELTDWTVAFVLPKNDITGPSEQIRVLVGDMTDGVIADTENQIAFTMIVLISVLILVLLITSLIAVRISGKITQPIMSLAQDVKKIGTGNLDYKSNIKTGDELEELSVSFQKMTVQLVEYITNLSYVTAEKERIGAELSVATQIQSSMLPSIFPPFPNRNEFDIYATMLPAKEVGGDFYDFFLLDEHRLAIVMADVSGKGVPAALFMVIAKTLIKNNAQSGKTPDEVFNTVNDMLCENNEAGMFVTAFMGVLDVRTGQFTYVNAGHNLPLIKYKGGDFEWLKGKRSLVLAGMEDTVYASNDITLSPGDVIYMYTDGVTEAVNNENELFSDPRLLEVANKYKDIHIKELLINIKTEIDLFAGGAQQADDITMLAMKISEL
jgi:sigma-B regulation protein RsbU (phosphoserine phosphatase)